MPIIRIRTVIKAPLATCFELATQSEFYLEALPPLKHLKTEATKDTLRPGHAIYLQYGFGLGYVPCLFRTSVTQYVNQAYITEETEGVLFTEFRHLREFNEEKEHVIMEETLEYELNFGWIGKWVDRFFLHEYLKKFLYNRRKRIAEAAEKAAAYL